MEGRVPLKTVRSHYTFHTTLPDGRLGLYNSKTGAVVCADVEEAGKLLSVLEDPVGNSESSFLPALVSQGFVVRDNCDELSDIRKWSNAFLSDERLLHLTMLPAEACNFACPYCFQYNKRHLFMKPWVYDAALELIKRSAAENQSRGQRTHIKISWFGGEPTLAAPKIMAFQSRLRALSAKCDLDVKCTMVTNGYLLTSSLFKKLLDVNIREFQVTLDGDNTTHDQLRTLKNGKPTFNAIYENLKRISQLPNEVQFKMTIRVNFLRTTIAAARNMTDMFVADFGHDNRFQIYCRPVYHFDTARDDIQTLASNICSIDEGIGLQRALAKMVMEQLKVSTPGGLFDPLPMPTPAWCPCERKYSYVIGADGLLFPCDNLIGDENYTIGHLSEDGTPLYNSRATLWKGDCLSDNDCLTCKLLPVCMGGCLRARIISKRQPCFWSESEILRSLQEHIELSTPRCTTG